MKESMWQQRLKSVLQDFPRNTGVGDDYPSANADLVTRSLGGIGVDGGKTEGMGCRVVVNISSAHIGSFCREQHYKNAYELERAPRIGKTPKVSEKRKIVDAALQAVTGHAPEKLYFAAVELNGAGIGFYGDCCLVLREQPSDENLTVLDRNSYDLIRDPLRTKIDCSCTPVNARADRAKSMSGQFKQDLPTIAAVKVLSSRPCADRLLTTGMISGGVLEDEDYIEILREESFGPTDIAEVRVSAADVSVDERIRSRGLGGLPPSHAELLWRRRRRVAEGRLAEKGIPVRVVTALGRSRG
jgi:hypothetical protein